MVASSLYSFPLYVLRLRVTHGETRPSVALHSLTDCVAPQLGDIQSEKNPPSWV